MIIKILLTLLFGLFSFASLYILGCYIERKRWDKGYCKKCSGEWKEFDRDSCNGRGYKCGNNHYIWVSYPIDKEQK
jgi:hypothetical protein